MKTFGRTFNHLEDLIFFYGQDGINEVIQHIQEIVDNTSSVRMKWDGSLQVYWGREYINGSLIMTGHNGWARGVKTTSAETLYDFIINHSGKDRHEPTAERIEYAKKFGSLFPLLDAATPPDFVGFVYADLLYWQEPSLVNEEYVFKPNHTEYSVHKDTILGKQIPLSNILLAGHAYFGEFGLNDEDQQPLSSFDQFNNTNEVIILDPYYSKVDIDFNLSSDDIAQLMEAALSIDEFLTPIQGVSSFREYIYKYMNYRMKNKTDLSFKKWINTTNVKISPAQRKKIVSRIENKFDEYTITFSVIEHIMHIKNTIIDYLENHDCDVKASNPEGWVKYADENKKFGNIKLVPRHTWTP